MSTNTILKGSAVAAMTFAAMSIATSANAQSRYGNVADYERGQNCGQACVAPAPKAHTSSRYGHTATHTAPMPVAPGPVYVNCAQMGTCAPQPSVVYTQPAPVQYQAAPVQSYSQQSYQTQSFAQAPANCPAGTTAQPDGTCMQSSYSSSTTYSEPASSYSSSTYSSTSSMPADCPAGTTAQSDGTCLQGGSTGYSAPVTSTYDSYSSSSYSSASSAPANCPAGTTAQPDGTCMEGGSSASYTGSSVEIYTGDASTSSSTTPSYGYTSDGSYAATDYLPIRK